MSARHRPGARGLLHDGNIEQVQVIRRLDEAVVYLKQALRLRSSVLKIAVNRSVPIYIGCQSPRLLESIGRWELGGLPMLTPPSYATEALLLMKKGAEQARVKLREKDLIACIFVSLAKEENSAAKTFADFITSVLRHLAPSQLQMLQISPKDVAEVIRRYPEEGWEMLPSKIYKLGAVGVERSIKTLNEVARAGFTRAKIGGPLGQTGK